MRFRTLGVLALAVLAGCTTINTVASLIDPTDWAKLQSVAKEDVALAITMAQNAKDPGAQYRLRCYNTLYKYAQSTPATKPTPPAGLVSGFEFAAEADTAVQTAGPLIPLDVQADCGYIKDSILKFAGRVGLKLAPLPGAGAVAPLLN